MKIKILEEAGHPWAILGLSLSYEQGDLNRVYERSKQLYRLDEGHNKFLESIAVWMDITASRDFWSEMDTYRAGMTKQSGSTMHTLLKRDLTINDFEDGRLLQDILFPHIARINELKHLNLTKRELRRRIKKVLPEGFLQRRILMTNYKTIRNIMKQRFNHGLDEWRLLTYYLLKNLAHPEYLQDIEAKDPGHVIDGEKYFILDRKIDWEE